jgi:hypothetical protein
MVTGRKRVNVQKMALIVFEDAPATFVWTDSRAEAFELQFQNSDFK